MLQNNNVNQLVDDISYSVKSSLAKNIIKINESDQDSFLIRNIDIKQDICSTKFEKDLKRLPSNLKFIRKYLYLEFIPKIDKIIGDLEAIKLSSNYDENVCNLRPFSVHKLPNITCFDLFETNNIKKSAINRMVYGTINGTLGIYDLDSQKILIEKQMNPSDNSVKSRIDVIGTSTIKYFDNYITRIALQLRGDPIIQILIFNHSYKIISSECEISLNELSTSNDANILLTSLAKEIKFSNDSYYMSIVDYSGGVKVFKFNDLPNSGVIAKDKIPQKNENPASMQLAFGSSKVQVINNNLPVKKQQDNPTNAAEPVLIANLKYKEIENNTIIPINQKSKEEANLINSNNAYKDKKPNQPIINKGQPPEKNRKQERNPTKKEALVIVGGDTGFRELANSNNLYYDNKAVCDEKTSNDITPLQKFNKNQPYIIFIQKKFVYQDKSNGGYVGNKITIGAYVSFYGSNNLKYISLYPYLTESMKNAFKLSKLKGAPIMSSEDSLALSSQMLKKEKDYINFIKSKLEQANSELNQIAYSSSNNFTELRLREINKDKGITSEHYQAMSNDISYKESTKNDLNFMLLFPITFLTGTNNLSKLTNVLCIGMKDGSILLWDTELHTDIVLFKEKRSEIVQMSMDDKYLMSSSLDGQIHVYNLNQRKLIFTCYNSPHRNYPIQAMHPFFPQMSLAIDHGDNMILYNNKEKHKAGKLILEHKNKNYKINYFNKILTGCNKDSLIFMASKDKNVKTKPNILEMILFQQQKEKPVLEKFSNQNSNYFNLNQESFSKQLLPAHDKSYLVVFKIKDVLFKCYPQLVMAHKKGISLYKLLTNYDVNNLPSFSEDKFSKMQMFNEKNKKKKNFLKEIAETEIDNSTHDSIEDTKGVTKYSDKEFIKIKNDLTIKYDSNQKSTSIKEEVKEKIPEQHIDIEIKSSQKQNILYYSFRNIRERNQYKDQRLNRIQARDEKILKELRLPEIKIGSDRLKENKSKNIT